MKFIIIYFLLLFLTTFTFAQNIQRIKIPLVIETTQVDSLIESFIPVAIPGKSCFVFHVRKLKDGYYCNVICKEANISLLEDDLLNAGLDLSYFNYKGYLILVNGDFVTSTFFKKTRLTKTFKFVKYKKKNDISEAIKGILGGGDFLFENSRFRKLNYSKS